MSGMYLSRRRVRTMANVGASTASQTFFFFDQTTGASYYYDAPLVNGGLVSSEPQPSSLDIQFSTFDQYVLTLTLRTCH